MRYHLLNNEKQIYLKEEAKETLREVKKLIFDFDGVLTQTSLSYRTTIKKVVDYYFLEILDLKGEIGKLATLFDIQKFKDTGLYNNDWKLSYGLISYYMNLIIRKLEQKNVLQDFADQFGTLTFYDIKSFIEDLKEVGIFLRKVGISGSYLANLKNDDTVGLDLFLVKDSLEKPKPIETSLLGVNPEATADKDTLVKQLVPYELQKPDLLKRLFEEIYLGKELYTKIYGYPSFFNFDSSLIDIEKFIPSKETLEMLRDQFGKFGIYSGRPKPQGIYVLEKYSYMEYFNEIESVFLGDLLNSEDEMEKLGKPDPTLFVKLIEKMLQKEKSIAYVGDGIADAILIEKTKAMGFENVSFLGIMSSPENSHKLFTEYSKHGADAIMIDVNDIPYLFTNLRGSV